MYFQNNDSTHQEFESGTQPSTHSFLYDGFENETEDTGFDSLLSGWHKYNRFYFIGRLNLYFLDSGFIPPTQLFPNPTSPLSYQLAEEQSFRLSLQMAELQVQVTREMAEISNKVREISRQISNLERDKISLLQEADRRKQAQIEKFETDFNAKLERIETDANEKIEQGRKENDKLLSALNQVENKARRAKREVEQTFKDDQSMAEEDNDKILGPLNLVLKMVGKLKPNGSEGTMTDAIRNLTRKN